MDRFSCRLCGYEWFPRQYEIPKRCPGCKSRRWNSKKELDLTQDDLRRLTSYCPDSGELRWGPSAKKPGRVRPGEEVGTIAGNGYRTGSVNGHKDLVHRFIWLWWYGFLPENNIDHIDGDKLNNRIDNLREVSFSCNMRNFGNPINNTSGVRGVSRNPKKTHKKKWKAGIAVNRKVYNLGYYFSFEEAVFARYAAEQCLGWHTCNSQSPAHKYLKVNGLVRT